MTPGDPSPPDRDQLCSALSDALREDYSEYWRLWKIARRLLGDEGEAAMNQMLLRWLAERRVLGGQMAPDGFRPWPIAVDEAVERTSKAIAALAAPPVFGDVGWFYWVH